MPQDRRPTRPVEGCVSLQGMSSNPGFGLQFRNRFIRLGR